MMARLMAMNVGDKSCDVVVEKKVTFGPRASSFGLHGLYRMIVNAREMMRKIAHTF